MQAANVLIAVRIILRQAYTPCLKKTVQICICQNFAKFPPISTSIFRRRALVRFLQREAELHLLHSCIHTLSYANLYNVSCCQLNFDIHVAYTTLALGASYGTRPDYHASWSIFSSFFLYIFCLSRVVDYTSAFYCTLNTQYRIISYLTQIISNQG